MYLSHYHLKKTPFQLTADPEFVWLDKKHKNYFSKLKNKIQKKTGGFFVLTGDAGSGKTTLMRSFIKSLDDDFIAAMISYPVLEAEPLDFFNLMISSFNIRKRFTSLNSLRISFMHFLNLAKKYNKKVLLVIDEAQCLSSDILHHLYNMNRTGSNHPNRINILFSGQINIKKTLQSSKNKPISQSITDYYKIGDLTLDETHEYIRFRLKIAGSNKDIFYPDSINAIYTFSNGCPLQINIICDLALRSGFLNKLSTINSETILKCKQNIQSQV